MRLALALPGRQPTLGKHDGLIERKPKQCKTSASPRYQPMKSPSGTPITTAIAKPLAARAVLASGCTPGSPDTAMSNNARKTTEKGGRKVERPRAQNAPSCSSVMR